MGNGNSKENPWPLRHPYRDEVCTKERDEQLLREILKISAPTENRERRIWNLLLIGPTGSGKSSFINSVLSIFKGTYTCGAFSGGNDMGNITSKFTSYYPDSPFDNLRIYDTPGISEGKGFNMERMTSILDGRVKEGLDLSSDGTFDENSTLYRKDPTEADKIHCVIYIMDICSLSTLDKSLKETIWKLQRKQIPSDVQRILILTKCDKLCDHVKRDVGKLFYSKMVLDEINRAREKLCFTGGTIHPIVNYGEQITKMKPEMNVPILLALKQCMDFSNEFMKKCVANPINNEKCGGKPN